MVKNPTPQQIALLAGAIILFIAFGSLLFFDHFPEFANPGGYLLWAPVFFFLVYRLVILLLRQYIYRKIKLIYKTIRQEKLGSQEKQDLTDITRNVIEEAEREVADWAERQWFEGEPGRDWYMAMGKVEGLLAEQGPSVDRSAAFVCTLAVAWPDGHSEVFEGRVEGSLTWPPRGALGFGYDPVFVASGANQTFAFKQNASIAVGVLDVNDRV